eukprot:scaffold137518_cov47-Attheya_sp.AAC.2
MECGCCNDRVGLLVRLEITAGLVNDMISLEGGVYFLHRRHGLERCCLSWDGFKKLSHVRGVIELLDFCYLQTAFNEACIASEPLFHR